MALQQITHIEGLEGYENVDLQNDTNPGVTQITFWVKSEELPGETALQGKVVRQNFVWIRKVINLGNLIVERRIKDKVVFDTTTQSWKVKVLAAGRASDGTPISDISRYPNEWNHFARNAKEEEAGTPISLLFKNDPSRAEMYKAYHVKTIEQLSACSETHIQTIGLGAREDISKAKAYLARLSSMAPSIALDAKLNEKDEMIAKLQAQLDDLSGKLTQVLTTQLETDAPTVDKAKRKRSTKQTENFETIEGTL
jgi:hypothetical protein